MGVCVRVGGCGCETSVGKRTFCEQIFVSYGLLGE